MHQATNSSKPCVRPFPSQAQPSSLGTKLLHRQNYSADTQPTMESYKERGKGIQELNGKIPQGSSIVCMHLRSRREQDILQGAHLKSSTCVSPLAHPGTHTAIMSCASEQEQFLCPSSTAVIRSAQVDYHSSWPASGKLANTLSLLCHLPYALCYFELLFIEKNLQLLFSAYG